jgi:Leucine-rich repeat (LRR) protein
MIFGEFLDKHYSKEEQKNLKRLNCYDSKLTSLKGIEKCTNLIDLNCSDNKLTSLKGIEKCTNLIDLNCSDNKLTSLKGIENLENLEDIFCYDNPLPYSNLEDLDKIKSEVKKEVRQEKIHKLLNN